MTSFSICVHLNEISRINFDGEEYEIREACFCRFVVDRCGLEEEFIFAFHVCRNIDFHCLQKNCPRQHIPLL